MKLIFEYNSSGFFELHFLSSGSDPIKEIQKPMTACYFGGSSKFEPIIMISISQ